MNRCDNKTPTSNPATDARDGASTERDPDELEPTITTPAGRFWDIELPADVKAALGLDLLR
jgi:hypothetical protein